MSTNPVRGVTEANFTALGKAYIGSNGGKGFIIALRPYPGFPADEKFIPKPRQWGAWMAYWARLKYKHKAIMLRGYATTPAEWPHEFDAGATIQGDHAAADVFEAHQRNERESLTFHAGGIARQSSKAMALWNQTKAELRPPTPQSHLNPEAEPAVDVSDFPSANATSAELREWEERQKKASAA